MPAWQRLPMPGSALPDISRFVDDVELLFQPNKTLSSSDRPPYPVDSRQCIMQYQDFVPVSYQPNSSESDSSLDFGHNSREQPNSSSRRSKLPLGSPKSGIRSQRQSQICGVPLLETALLPSLRDTIDRMTRPPSRIASATSPAPSVRETSCDSGKGDSLAPTEYRSPVPQRIFPLPPSNHSVQSVETIVSPSKHAPKSLKSALRSPKTPNIISPPSLSSPALRSVKSILSKKCKTPPSSKNQGISSKDIFATPTEDKPFQSNSRTRSYTVPGGPPPPINSLSGKQPTYNYAMPSEDKDVQVTPKTRTQSPKSNIPRPATTKKRPQIPKPASATEDSDIEFQYETDNRNRRRLTVANAEVYPSSSSASGLASDPSATNRFPPKSPTAAKQYSSLRRETKWSHKGLGLAFDSQADSSVSSIYSRNISSPSLVSNNAKDTSSSSHGHAIPENERRQVALLKLVSGLDLERQNVSRGGHIDGDESDYGGEGVALSASVGEKRNVEMGDDASLYDDDFEEDGRYHSGSEEKPYLTPDMQSNAHSSDFWKQKHRWAIHGSPDEIMADSPGIITPSLPGRSPSRTPVIRRSMYDAEISPAVLKRRSIYIEQPTTPSQESRAEHYEEKGNCTACPDGAYSGDERDVDHMSIGSKTANAILARARRAFGIPQSESERLRENSHQQDHRSSLAESELSSAGSTFWRATRVDDASDVTSALSVGATSLFRNLSDCSDDRAYKQRSTAFPASGVSISKTQDANHESHTTREDPKKAPLAEAEMARQRIIREFCTSEETFVARLHVCVQLFILPLRIKDSKVWVDGVPPDIAHFLDWFEDIANLHTYDIAHALGSIQRRAAGTQDQTIKCISEKMLPMIPKLDVYQPYIARLSSVAVMVSQMVRDGGNDFGEFVAIQQRSPECGGWGLEAFLLEPMNRLTKYCDIFSRLLSSTPKNHPDYLPTFSLLQSIDVIVRVMTEVKLCEDKYDLMKELISGIQGLPPRLQLASRERRLLHHGCICIFEDYHQGDGGLSSGSMLTDDRDLGTSTRPTFKERAGNRMSRLASAVQAWDARRGRSGSIKSTASSCAGSSIRSDDFRGSLEVKFLDNATSFETEPTPGMLRPAQLLLFSDVAILATPIAQNSGKPMYQLMDDLGLSHVFHAEFESDASRDGSVVVLDLISLDADLKMSSMRLTTVRAKIMPGKADDELSIQRQIEQWQSAFHGCSQFTLRLLSHPTVSHTASLHKNQDLLHITKPRVASGLPVPKSPSAQALDRENGMQSSPTQQEREKRGWWTLRFQQVLQGMSRS